MIKRWRWAVLFCLLPVGCAPLDDSLKNEANILMTDWATAHEDLAWVERNLAQSQVRCDRVIKQIHYSGAAQEDSVFRSYADSIYKSYIWNCRSMEQLGTDTEHLMGRLKSTHQNFNIFYKRLFKDDYSSDQDAAGRLAQYSRSCTGIRQDVGKLRDGLEHRIDYHNSLLEHLSKLSPVYASLGTEVIHTQ